MVNLKGAPKPVSFLLVSGGGVYDADMTVHVDKRGPNARGPATGPAAPDTASPFLTAMLQGVAPADAAPLNVVGVNPDDFRAWKIGDRVVIRTVYQLVSPEWFASESAEGGVTVYSLPATPVVLLSKNGQTVSASLSGALNHGKRAVFEPNHVRHATVQAGFSQFGRKGRPRASGRDRHLAWC